MALPALAPIAGKAAAGLGKAAGIMNKAGMAKKAGDSDTGKKLLKIGCALSAAAIIMPVLLFLAILQALVRGAVNTKDNGCTIPIGNTDTQLQSYLQQNGAIIAVSALQDAGIGPFGSNNTLPSQAEQDKLIVMTAIAGAASNFDANASGGYWKIPGAPTATQDPDKGAAMAVAAAGGSSLTKLSYFSGNEAYQAFVSAGGVTKSGINWSIAETTFDSGGFFSQASSALQYVLSNPTGGCQCSDSVSGSGGGTTGGGGGTIPPVGNISTSADFAKIFLADIHVPVSDQNIIAIEAWTQAEDPWSTVLQTHNPMNTTQDEPGATSRNSVGVKAYPNWQEGVQASVTSIENGYYGAILSALQAGNNAYAVANAIGSSPWGTSGSLITQIIQGWGDKVPPPSGGGGGGGTGSGSPCGGQGVGGCLNPIKPGLYGPARTDMGTDWLPNSANTPVYAACPGVIMYASENSGWPGIGGYVNYKITAGAQAGHCVYVGENVTNIKPVGTTFAAGAQIASSQPGYAWTEWGWANCAPQGVYGGPLTPYCDNHAGYNSSASSGPCPDGSCTPGGRAFANFIHDLGGPWATVDKCPWAAGQWPNKSDYP